MEMTAKIKINVNKTFYCGNCRACRWDKDNKMKYCELYNRFLEPYHADVVVKCNECLLAVADTLRNEV